VDLIHKHTHHEVGNDDPHDDDPRVQVHLSDNGYHLLRNRLRAI